MNFDEVIVFLLTGLGYSLRGREKAWYVTFDAVKRWEPEILLYLEREGLLKRVEDTDVLACDGCTEHCPMEVEVYPAIEGGDEETESYAFIVCDQSDEMGRIPVAVERLQQWMVSLGQLAQWVSRLCGLKAQVEYKMIEENKVEKNIRCRLGILDGIAHRQSVYLWGSKEGVIMIGTRKQRLPLTELLKLKGGNSRRKGRIEINLPRLKKMVDKSVLL
jgi:hypothetical protein